MSKEARGLVSPYLSNGRQYKIPCLIGPWELYYQGYWDIYICVYEGFHKCGIPKMVGL